MKHTIEIDLNHYSMSHENQPYWLGIDSVVTEGETLQDLIKGATIFTVDQDGGEGPELNIESLTNQQSVIVAGEIVRAFNRLEAKQ